MVQASSVKRSVCLYAWTSDSRLGGSCNSMPWRDCCCDEAQDALDGCGMSFMAMLLQKLACPGTSERCPVNEQ